MNMIITVLFVLACIHVGAFEEDYKIPANINLDEILANDRLLKNYVNCVLDNGKARCTPEGERLKKVIPEAIQTGCSRCNDQVKGHIRKVFKNLRERHPDLLDQLLVKYDPNGEYRQKHKDLLQKEGIDI